jgi:ubiquinone/menaquinone biosynthesis C-methylase UbiE
MTYSARYHYQSAEVAATYEQDRFGGRLGHYRYRREQRAVQALFDLLPERQVVLDCPMGIGRWAELLVSRGHEVLGCDLSSAMLAVARTRFADSVDRPVMFVGDAEGLPLPSKSVDYVFSHALTKHLPREAQHRVLSEFARCAKSGVIISFSVLSGLPGLYWRARRIPDAHAVPPDVLADWFDELGLVAKRSRSCTTPIGVERTMLLEFQS